MMKFNALHFGVLASGIILTSGCGHGLSEAMMEQASRTGVYAQTASKLLEISHYGAFTLDPFDQQIQFKFDHSIPQIVGPIGFVINIPNTVMNEARVFLLPSIEAGIWHKNLTTPSYSKPISSSLDAVAGSIYKVTPDLPNDATGFLCIWVKMTAGSDRLYAIQIKK